MRRTSSSKPHVFAHLGFAALTGFAAALAFAAPGSASSTNEPLLPESKTLDKQHSGESCVTVDEAKYTHTFVIDQSSHTATATIRLDSNLCEDEEQPFTLVSYLAPSASFSVPQYAFDQETHVITSTDTAFAFEVEVPECYTQVDFFFGDEVITPLTDESDRYGDNKVGSDSGTGSQSSPADGSQKHAWYNGGDVVCETAPSVEAVSDCDGSVVLNLRNGANASTTSYIITSDNGYETTVEVLSANPVAQVTISADNAANLTISSGGETVQEYSWSQPDDCLAPTISTESDCTESKVTIANASENSPVEATLLVAGEDSAQTVTVAAGESETVSFDAGVTVSVTVYGKTTVLDLAKPDSCDSSSLPVTGTNAIIIAGVAILLVAGGSGMFLFTRARRVTFRA